MESVSDSISDRRRTPPATVCRSAPFSARFQIVLLYCPGGIIVREKTEKLDIRVTPQELERIKAKKEEVGIRNMSAYLRKMAMDGYCINLDIGDIREMTTLLRRCSNNLNQYAKRANATDSIYAEDIKDLQERLDEIWDLQKKLLRKLAELQCW